MFFKEFVRYTQCSENSFCSGVRSWKPEIQGISFVWKVKTCLLYTSQFVFLSVQRILTISFRIWMKLSKQFSKKWKKYRNSGGLYYCNPPVKLNDVELNWSMGGIIKMKFSKKSRYGLTSLIDLSVHSKNGHVALNSIAERNDISPQYLEPVSYTHLRLQTLPSQRIICMRLWHWRKSATGWCSVFIVIIVLLWDLMQDWSHLALAESFSQPHLLCYIIRLLCILDWRAWKICWMSRKK